MAKVSDKVLGILSELVELREGDDFRRVKGDPRQQTCERRIHELTAALLDRGFAGVSDPRLTGGTETAGQVMKREQQQAEWRQRPEPMKTVDEDTQDDAGHTGGED